MYRLLGDIRQRGGDTAAAAGGMECRPRGTARKCCRAALGNECPRRPFAPIGRADEAAPLAGQLKEIGYKPIY